MTELSDAPATDAIRFGTTAGAGVADYIEILKPRVMSLVVFTGFVGLVVAGASDNSVTAADAHEMTGNSS